MMATTPTTSPSHFSCKTEFTVAKRSRRAHRTFVPFSRKSSSVGARMMRTILLVCALFAVANAQKWACPTPKGSYLDTCDSPVGHPYTSTDPNLSHVKFCLYTIACKKMKRPNSDKRNNYKILPMEDAHCGRAWENCHGYLVAQSEDTRLCTDEESARKVLQSFSLIPPDRTEL